MVIWNVFDLQSQDIEGSNDLYVVASLNKNLQKTDIHYRSLNGEGSFNWRILWREKLPLNIPKEDQSIIIQVWDKDIGKADDFIGEYKLDIFEMLRKIEETENVYRINDGEVIEFELKVKYKITIINFNI